MAQKTEDPRQQGKSPRGYAWIVYILIFNMILLYYLGGRNSTEEITWSVFRAQMLLKNDVEKIEVVNKETAEVYIKKDSLRKPRYKAIQSRFTEGKGPQYSFGIGSPESFERKLDEAQTGVPEDKRVPVTYTSHTSGFASLLSWVLPLGMLLLFLFYLRRAGRSMSGPGSIFDFAKSRGAEYSKAEMSPITFKDVAGYDEAKTEVMEIVEFLKQPAHFTRLGAKIPKGILLVGPPGSGKTLLARAVAGEAAVPFFSLSGSEFIEIFVGVGASRVRDLFEKAKQKAPSIIFIDEIDTVGRARGRVQSMQANDERDSTLNQMLTEMDGFAPNTGVIVMAATNRADILDPALLRAGRFDRHIYLDLPNKNERKAIFDVHLRPLRLDNTVNSELLAEQTPGFSGADIANVCNEAALVAARGGKDAVGNIDFYAAIDRIVGGLEKKSKIISPGEKKVIAYHEAGHAIVSWLLPSVDPLVKVSIIPRGKSLGSAWYLPDERQITTLSQFSDQICAALGGRVAEEIVFGEPSSGALDDLEKVTKLAYAMVMQLGLDPEVGNVSYFDSTGTYQSSFQKPYSEETGRLIDQEVRNLVDKAHSRTSDILNSKRKEMDELASLLLEKEVIYKEDVQRILGAREQKPEK